MIKKDIIYLKKLQRISQSKKRSKIHKSADIKDTYFFNVLKNEDWFKRSQVVASFLSIKSEISTTNLNRDIKKLEKILCLPVISQDNNGLLIFKEYVDGDKLVHGKYGVKEPINSNIRLPEIIFTPCLAFDCHGYRLGYGGGYYDKTISYLHSIRHNFLTIGLAYGEQKVKNVIHDNLDQKLNYILTEKELYKFL